MTVVIPFHNGDVSAVIRLLGWIADLGSCKTHDCVLCADADTQYDLALKAKSIASESFGQVSFITNGKSVKGWIPGSNSLFYTTAHRLQGRPFFWLEPDAVPLHRDWLDLIESHYNAAGKPFMGTMIRHDMKDWPNPYMEGVAVYSKDTYALLGSVRQDDVSWTNTTAGAVIDKMHDTSLIHHIWGENGNPPTFSEIGVPGTSIFTLDAIRPGAMIFHRNKDGSLIRLLRKNRHIGHVDQVGNGRIVVRRTAALGDVLAATAVADKLHEMGYDVEFQSHEHTHCLTRRVHSISHVTTPNGHCDINLDNAYESHPERASRTFGELFLNSADAQLSARGVSLWSRVNWAPKLNMTQEEAFGQVGHILTQYPKPWVMICPRSNSHLNRTIPDNLWSEIASRIKGTCFWLGSHGAAPHHIVDLQCRHMDRLIWFVALCDVMCSVDTGPMHVASALRKPVVGIEQASSPEVHLSDQRDFLIVSPQLACLNCQDNVCRIHSNNPPCQFIDPDLVARAVNRKLDSIYGEDISAAICIFRPPVHRLNKCIESVIGQVQEVVVSVDGEGVIPQGAIRDPKIRYVANRFGRRLGYAKNANHCARHTNGKWILLMNDDVFLAPDAVQRMKEVAYSNVGMVGQLLRYPDGTIQHGGTYRNPGDIGFGHVDHKAVNSRYTEPLEMENITLASALVRRSAFYEVDGFDEMYDCYCEDNDLCMKIRQAGWRIMYQPKATGIHEESQTTRNLPDVRKTMERSCQIFGDKWRWYFAKNTKPGLGKF